MSVSALLVTGATGAGKTTYLSRLIAQRPAAARWAVLVNDFGEARLRTGPGLAVREVAGCICCSGQVSLRTAIVALLRDGPERLLIEASAAAHPDAIVHVLNEPGIASAVTLERTVCVADPAQALDPRYANLELYREQVKAADEVVLSKTDARAEEALRAMGAQRIEHVIPDPR
ncbi:MAG TPA: ATPase, T2SS/T4P/T4SS family [Burkholderiales bacterium]|nr:ATPase, T2SS/T4P/T4SS family [Burkholderiales bacterium]